MKICLRLSVLGLARGHYYSSAARFGRTNHAVSLEPRAANQQLASLDQIDTSGGQFNQDHRRPCCASCGTLNGATNQRNRLLLLLLLLLLFLF